MSRGIFITGTDTDVGKTVITAGILRYLRRAGLNAASMKPAQTGAEPSDDGRLRAPDLTFHHRVSGLTVEPQVLDLMAPYCYEPACSPHLAGRMADHYPDLPRIWTNATELMNTYEVLLVEGAGGVYAPLNEDETMLDLMKTLAFPVILVAHRGLGTINHTLLSLQALRSAGLEVLGVVFNETSDVEPDFIKKDNPDAVQHFGQVAILGNIDYLGDLESDPETAWARFEQCMPGLAKLRD